MGDAYDSGQMTEADAAASQAQEEGFATRLAPIPMPTNPKRLADLLSQFDALAVRALR